MRKKIMRPWLNNTLVIIDTVLFLLLVSIDDFKINAFPIIICGWLLAFWLFNFIIHHSKTEEFNLNIKENNKLVSFFNLDTESDEEFLK